MGDLDLKNISVIVGLSGGVDSSVAALLLKQAGFDVIGVYLKCYWTYEGCQSDQDRNSAARVASVLNIPFEVWDFEREYREKVVEYFFEEYKRGRTPNPDVVCNREIKFGLFLNRALEQTGPDEIGSDSVKDSLKGSHLLRLVDRSLQRSLLPESSPKLFNNIYIATGHYARLGVQIQKSKIKDQNDQEEIIFPKFSQWEEVADNGGVRYVGIRDYLQMTNDKLTDDRGDSGIRGKLALFGGVDSKKDQSYFLYDIPKSTYEHILYPLGNLTKKQVREIAKKENLPTATRPDSSGICFIGEVNIEKFLKERIAEHEGNVIDKSGKIIGKHRGVEFYTIGQRHGFKIDNSLVYHAFSESAVDIGRRQTSETPYVSLPAHSPRTEPQGKPNKPTSEAAWASSKAGILRDSLFPLYVIGKNVERNELVVGMGEECKTQKLSVIISGKFQNSNFKSQTNSKDQNLYVRVRNLGEFIPCEVSLGFGDCYLEVTLAWPVFGVAPGQSAVFYRKFEIRNSKFEIWCVAGGGVIQ